MEPESLQALLIDRELGELSPEAAELLDAWLASHPESAASIPPLRDALQTARAAVRQYPELAQPEPAILALPARRFRLVPLALAASVALMLGGAAWLGFHAGQLSTTQALAAASRAPAAVPAADSPVPGGPWARYALASDPRGGLTVVRCPPRPQL